MATPKASKVLFDRDVIIRFPEQIQRTAGLAPEVGFDGLAFLRAGDERYFLLENKHVENIASRVQTLRTESVEREMLDMMRKQRTMAELLGPYGCQGVFYSTNNPKLASLMAEMIESLEPRGATKWLFPPGY